LALLLPKRALFAAGQPLAADDVETDPRALLEES